MVLGGGAAISLQFLYILGQKHIGDLINFIVPMLLFIYVCVVVRLSGEYCSGKITFVSALVIILCLFVLDWEGYPLQDIQFRLVFHLLFFIIFGLSLYFLKLKKGPLE